MPVMITLVDGTIPVAADFNTNFTNLNSALGASTAITGYTTGDIVYASAANTLSKLAIGSTAQALAVSGGLPAWVNAGTFLPLTGLALSNGTDATNDIDIAVGTCVSQDAAIADRVSMSLTSILVKQLDAVWAVGTNAGMRATGVAIANTTYHIFLIKRPDTGVVDVAADTSPTGANIAANTDAAYTKIRRIGSIVRAGATILGFSQDGDTFWLSTPVLDISNTAAGTGPRTLHVLASMPTGFKLTAIVDAGFRSAGASGRLLYLSSPDSADAAPSTSASPLYTIRSNASTAEHGGPFYIRADISAQIGSRVNSAENIDICLLGWIDRRGQG